MRSVMTAFLGVALLARIAAADLLHVPADYPTIQAAINASSNGDEVVIAPGTYNEIVNFGGKAITVRGSGPVQTVVDGTPPGGGTVVRFLSNEGPNSVLRDLTVTGAANGGGILATNANPTIINCHISGNNNNLLSPANFGGGLRQTGPQMLVKDCLFLGNSVSASQNMSGVGVGGGAAVQNALFVNCSFVGNTAAGSSFLTSSGGGDGGGAWVQSPGAGVFINCLFQDNFATGDGHGYGGGVAGFGSVTMVNCAVTNNRVSASKGIADGAGVKCNSNATLINCTIANNTVMTPGASTFAGGVWGAASLANCIVVGNTVADVHSIATAHHSCIEGGFPGAGNIDADPLFVDTATGIFRLQARSPCRDIGDNTALPADTYDLDGDGNTTEPLPLDLDAHRRIVGGTVDRGCYEFQTCPADIVPDESVNLSDLLEVIYNWGPCPPPCSPVCPADVDPALAGDCQVNINDLLAVINAWGPCP